LEDFPFGMKEIYICDRRFSFQERERAVIDLLSDNDRFPSGPPHIFA